MGDEFRGLDQAVERHGRKLRTARVGFLQSDTVAGRDESKRKRLDVQEVAGSFQRQRLQVVVALVFVAGTRRVDELVERRKTGGNVAPDGLRRARLLLSPVFRQTEHGLRFKGTAVKAVTAL